MSTTLTPSLCGSRRMVTGTENSKVFSVDLRANVRDLADRDAAELDRRARRQPAHRLLEDQHDRSADCAAAGLKASVRSPNRVKTVFASAGGRTGIARGRLERDAADQDRQHRLGLHAEAARGERHVDPARLPEARVRVDVLVVGRLHEHLDGQATCRPCRARTTRPDRPAAAGRRSACRCRASPGPGSSARRSGRAHRRSPPAASRAPRSRASAPSTGRSPCRCRLRR